MAIDLNDYPLWSIFLVSFISIFGASEIGRRLGVLKTLAEHSGLSEEELRKQLSQILPGVVDKLTPNGRLPTLAELAQ